MTKTLTGGCACGAIRYEARGEPVFANHCQCRECQKRSGTGHSSYLTFAGRTGVSITGDATIWKVAGDSGNLKAHAFCPICGTPVFTTFDAMPDHIAIHAASLDEPGAYAPTAVTYHVRGHGWDTLDRSLQIFQKMPG